MYVSNMLHATLLHTCALLACLPLNLVFLLFDSKSAILLLPSKVLANEKNMAKTTANAEIELQNAR